jgi:hypothetical protein
MSAPRGSAPGEVAVSPLWASRVSPCRDRMVRVLFASTISATAGAPVFDVRRASPQEGRRDVSPLLDPQPDTADHPG